jgi:TonB family protein
MACGSEKKPEQPKSCVESVPDRISGLNVSGARSEKNVIKNLWPLVCKARELYRERLAEKTGIEGTIDLKLNVEFNGEVGAHSIARSTVKDPELEKRVLRLIQFADFDVFGPQNSETEILLPIRLKP